MALDVKRADLPPMYTGFASVLDSTGDLAGLAACAFIKIENKAFLSNCHIQLFKIKISVS